MGNDVGLRPRWLLVRSLAAAAIGGVPGVTSRLFSSLVSRCRAEGLLIATALASAGAHFRLERLGKEDEDEAGSGDW